MSLTPEIQGTVQIRSEPATFLQAFRRRVGAGLLSDQPHPRSNYAATLTRPDRLQVRAADWATAINVGLNEVDLGLPQRGSVRYQVRYWRWASFVLGLGAVFGAIGLVLLLTFDVPRYIARHPERMIPGLTAHQGLLLAWAMVVFWGFVWPWILIALHKPPLRRLMTRLITEVDASGTGTQ